MAAIPVGGDLSTGSVATAGLPLNDGLPPDSELVEINLSPGVALTSGELYAIVCRCPTATYSSPTVNNAVTWKQDTAAGYPDGHKCINDSSGDPGDWAASLTRDCYFVTKASGVTKDSHTVADAYQFIYAPFWVAQVFQASSSYTITSVILDIGRSWKATDPGTLYVALKEAEDVPTKATTPAPSDTASDVTLDQANISWTDGGNSDTYNVYYGPTSGSLPLVSSAQAGTSFSLSTYLPLAYGVTRYWRIDSINEAGTTTGDEWSFTTISLGPPVDTVIIGRLVAAANNKIWYESI